MGNVAQLNIGKDGSLALPVDVVTQKLAFLGRTGSGKTFAATKLAELMLEAGAQIVALDPVGVWHGLRLGDGFEIPVFGGLHGDIPLEPTGGSLIADLIVDRGISAVLDVSQMISAEQARFATAFATRFFQRKKAAPSAVHLFVEECQEFVPQNVMRGDGATATMLGAFERLWKLGRNFGIGGSLISQRPQEVAKKALNQAEVLFSFQMNGPQEREAMRKWVAEKGISEDIDAVLPKLATGQAHVWSPSWLQVSKTIRIAHKRSADASSTPLVGQRQVAAQPLKPIDLERIRADMAATIERAKADDPKELRRRIVELDRELLKVRGDKPAAEKVEVPVITAADMERLERHLGIFNRGIERLEEMHASVGEYIEAVQADVAALRAKADAIALPVRPVATICNVPKRPETRAAVARMAEHAGTIHVPPRPFIPGVQLTKTQQRILDTIAMLNVRGIEPTRDCVARWQDLHPKGGRYGSDLGTLRAAGHLDGFILTDTGAALAQVLPAGLDAALAALPDDSMRRTLAAIHEHGRPLTRDELAAVLGVHPKGGRFGSQLGWLRTMGVITERGPIAPTEGLYR